jgi:hypothetical protein
MSKDKIIIESLPERFEQVDQDYLPKYTAISVSYELGSLAKSLSSDIQRDEKLDGYTSEGLKATQDQWLNLIEEMVWTYKEISNGDHDLSPEDAKKQKTQLTLLYKHLFHLTGDQEVISKIIRKNIKEVKELDLSREDRSSYIKKLSRYTSSPKLDMVLDDYIKSLNSIMTKARAEAYKDNNKEVIKMIKSEYTKRINEIEKIIADVEVEIEKQLKELKDGRIVGVSHELQAVNNKSDNAYFLSEYVQTLKYILRSSDPIAEIDKQMEAFIENPSFDIRRAIKRAKTGVTGGNEVLSNTILDLRKNTYIYQKLLFLKKKVSK